MREPNSHDPQEFDALSRQIDELLGPAEQPAAPEADIDLTQYAPADIAGDEEIQFQNFSNQYGGQPTQAYNPDMKPRREQSADRVEYRDYGEKPSAARTLTSR